jgi:acetoin utilization deacetylase AcuC-like enzyme
LREVAPAAARFQPDVILVSAGYDAHWRDQLAGLNYRTGTYHRLSARLKELADEMCGGAVPVQVEFNFTLSLENACFQPFVALQVAFERQTLKPVFHLIGYRLLV